MYWVYFFELSFLFIVHFYWGYFVELSFLFIVLALDMLEDLSVMKIYKHHNALMQMNAIVWKIVWYQNKFWDILPISWIDLVFLVNLINIQNSYIKHIYKEVQGINVRWNLRGNQEWKIQRHWQIGHKTQNEDEPKINQHRKLDKDGQHGPQPKTGDECRCSWRAISPCFYDIRHVTHSDYW